MTEINELEGEELAAAVAEARGLKQNPKSPRWWDYPDRVGVCIDDGEDVYIGGELYSYRPDRDIAQAWELDGEGWWWSFTEYADTLQALVLADNLRHANASVKWVDFPTKARAYATARCRAYLKAKVAQ